MNENMTPITTVPAAPFGEVFAKIKNIKEFLSFDGRARRGEYWVTALLALLPLFILTIIGSAVALNCGLFAYAIVLLLGFALGAFMYPVTVRRWHDHGVTGWLAIAVQAGSYLPFIGWLVSIAALVFYCIPGKRMANDFGPDPLDPSAAADGQYKKEPALPFWIAYGALQLIYFVIALIVMNNLINELNSFMSFNF